MKSNRKIRLSPLGKSPSFSLCHFELGIALLELALVIPVILLILAAGLEFSRSMATYSRMNAVIREITGAAFRDCAKKAVGPELSATVEVRTCLTDVLNGSSQTTVNMLPGATVILSAFRWDTSYNPNPARLVGIVKNSGPESSRLQVSDFAAANPFRNKLLEDQVVLIYGEIYLTYTPIIPMIAGIFGYGNRSFYVAAAF